jgi:type 1 fimbriae regulatory protein FimB/type 1 fimbriae regulatory protein FimE
MPIFGIVDVPLGLENMTKPLLSVVPSVTVFGTERKSSPPRKRPNLERRSREFLTEVEVEALIKATAGNRHSFRDATMILIAFRHGLRSAELVGLKWDQVDFNQAVLHVIRRKNGTPATHPLSGREMRALRRLRREQQPPSSFVFTSERGAPFSTRGFRALMSRLGRAAGLGEVSTHQLRHACGYKLANDGHDTRSLQSYLGHKQIQHTVRYTELAPHRFKNFWHESD